MVSRTIRSLESYRQAAARIRSRKGRATVPDIARELGFRQMKLDALTSEWLGYVGVASHSDAVRDEYLGASDTLRGLGKPRTLANMAEILGRSFETVREYLERHPEVASYCDVEGRYDIIEAAYEAAACRLRASARAITRKELAFELSLPYQTVANLLAARPLLRKRIGVVGRRPNKKKRKRRSRRQKP